MSLDAELAAVIEASGHGGAAIDFASWAHRIFRRQYECNAPYRAFCDRRGVTPATVASWEDIPAVPTRAFRTTALACGPVEREFRTSGTTGGTDTRGRHLIPHLALYRASALGWFVPCVLPDATRLARLALLPPPAVRGDSSLVQMAQWVGDALCTTTEWFADAHGFGVEQLRDRLGVAVERGEAVLLFGPTVAFARLFAALRDSGRTLRLPPPSRLMDTGGSKGLVRPLSRGAFFREAYAWLGLASYFCVNEYGMTELCSQRYDSVLRDRFAGASLAPRRLVPPPWLRTRVLDPDTLRPAQAGEAGLLCHHDLANAGSVAVVLTEDIGRTVGDDGIEILGRVEGAVPRGCGSLLADLREPG